MDNEIRDILVKLLEGQTKLEIETALTNTSKDIRKVEENIRNIDENIYVLKDMTDRHEVDINILKRRPV